MTFDTQHVNVGHPLLWEFGDTVREPVETEQASAEDLLHAGFGQAHADAVSPVRYNLEQARSQWLELKDEVDAAFWYNTSKYDTCSVNKFRPDPGHELSGVVVDVAAKAKDQGIFDKIKVQSYGRRLGNVDQPEWALIGTIIEQDTHKRKFLLAWWSVRGQSPQSMGVIKSMYDEKRAISASYETQVAVPRSLAEDSRTLVLRHRIIAYRFNWLFIALLSGCALATGIHPAFWAVITSFMLMIPLSMRSELKSVIARKHGLPDCRKAKLRLRDFPKPSRVYYREVSLNRRVIGK